MDVAGGCNSLHHVYIHNHMQLAMYLRGMFWLFPGRLGFAPLDLPLKTVAVELSLTLDQCRLHSLELCQDVPGGWVPNVVYAHCSCIYHNCNWYHYYTSTGTLSISGHDHWSCSISNSFDSRICKKTACRIFNTQTTPPSSP